MRIPARLPGTSSTPPATLTVTPEECHFESPHDPASEVRIAAADVVEVRFEPAPTILALPRSEFSTLRIVTPDGVHRFETHLGEDAARLVRAALTGEQDDHEVALFERRLQGYYLVRMYGIGLVLSVIFVGVHATQFLSTPDSRPGSAIALAAGVVVSLLLLRLFEREWVARRNWLRRKAGRGSV